MTKTKTKQVKIKISKKVFAPIYLKNEALDIKDRYLILYGGAGSGKSYFATYKVLYRLLTEKKHKFLVIRKVAATLKDSVFDLFVSTIEAWGLSKLFKITKNPMEITCVNGNKIIFKGLDDPEKIKSISGVTSVWVEEASELTREDFQQLNLRIRGKNLRNYVQYLITFNPISETHWLKKDFFDRKQPSTTIIKTTYLDNPFLDDSYINSLENLKNMDHQYYRIYALGEWGSLGNLVYSNYSIEDIPLDLDYYDEIYNGIDFGWNDPTAFVKVGVKDGNIYILDELYRRELTNPEVIELLKDKLTPKEWIIGDSSEPDRIREFQRAGYRMSGAKKGKNSIRHGIDFIRSKKVYIHPNCINFINEIQSYKYKEDKNGQVFEDPVDFNNHLLDALRYALENLRKLAGSRKPGRQITKSMLGL